MTKTSPQNPTPGKSLTLALAALLTLTAALVFAPILRHDLINFDDPGYIIDNPHVNAGLTQDSIRWALTTDEQSNWHPLTWLSLMLDQQIFSGKTWGFKLTSLILHAANTLLLFLALNLMTRATWPSAFVAALFALHPLHVESVAWVSERKDTLSTLFAFAAIIAYTLYAQRSEIRYYLAALAALALGLMAKPMLVTLPLLLILIDLWPLRRFQTAGNPKIKSASLAPSIPQKSLTALIIEKIPFMIIALASCIITIIVQRHGGALKSLEMYSFAVRVQNALIAYLTYLAKTFVPINLAVLYPHPGPHVSTPFALAAAVILIIITVLAIRQRLKRPYITVGWLWFLGTLVPVIGLVQVGQQALADRYTYIPLIGVFMLITWLAADWLNKKQNPRPLAFALAAATLITLTAITLHQLAFWQNSVTLNAHAIAVTKNNASAMSNLGAAFNDQQEYQKAIEQFNRALAINPNCVPAHNNIAFSYISLDQYELAIPHYDQAIKHEPKNPDFYIKKGQALEKLARYDQAAQTFQKALDLDPKNPAYLHNVGLSLAKNNQLDQALPYLTRAADFAPPAAKPEYLSDLGNAYLLKNDYTAAIRFYQQALDANPDYRSASANLNIALISAGQPDQAVQNARRFADKHPNDADALCDLGNILLNTNQKSAAAAAFKKALMINPSHPAANQGLTLSQ